VCRWLFLHTTIDVTAKTVYAPVLRVKRVYSTGGLCVSCAWSFHVCRSSRADTCVTIFSLLSRLSLLLVSGDACVHAHG
jgi:hypothetical protein